MRTYNEVQTGEVFIEATIKVRVNYRTTLYDGTEDCDEYLSEALYNGDFEIIDTPKVDTFEVYDVENDVDEIG